VNLSRLAVDAPSASRHHRRMAQDHEELLLHYLLELRGELKNYLDPLEIKEVERAFLLGEVAHRGQNRKSGEPYITHPVAVAKILAELRLDAETLIAAILHDTIEDTDITKDRLISEFGSKVANLVDGVTKLEKVNFATKEQQAAESLRKMFFSMARDPRVILIKLADRLHNMRTLGAQSSSSARRIARETLDVYAPIAQRLGMNAIKSELQDLGFRALYPLRHKVIAHRAKAQLGKRREVLSEISTKIVQKLKDERISARIVSRIKTPYSIYSKIRKLKSDKSGRVLRAQSGASAAKHRSFDDVTDVYGFRVITPKALNCYTALGLIHGLYVPKEARFKDFIAVPKANGYQSLHTGVQGPGGVPIEVQIRTDEMDSVAERGMAAHWLYKASTSSSETASVNATVKSSEWMRDLVESQTNVGNSFEFLEAVKADLVFDEVYLFTPNNKIVTLPANASALDFAYAVHSGVGDHAVTARIDGRTAPLHSKLLSGQTVQIVTAKSATPKAQWLEIVVTAKARTAIRHHLKTLSYQEVIGLGHRMLERTLSALGSSLDTVPDGAIAKTLAELKLKRLEELLSDIGLGNRTPEVVARQLTIGVVAAAEHARLEVVRISGTERGAITFAHCCHPIPGDAIFGYLSPGRGLMVHEASCHNVADLRKSEDRTVVVAWDEQVSGDFNVQLRIEVTDQAGVLARVTATFAEARINILDFQKTTSDGDNAVLVFTVQVKNVEHLEELLRRMRMVDVVQKVLRVVG
jgi:GTP diphosphokinase / guanosine-3',5'-bis(diphosphate) 3'-diphosphatase